jgi:hypothetical protein
MKKKMSLNQVVDLLADCVTFGIDINIDSDSEVKTISARNSRNGKTVKFTFKVPVTGLCQVLDWEETTEPVNKPED